MRELGEGGWLRFCVPALHGGASAKLDVRALCLCRETLAQFSSLADFAFAMQGLGSGPISLYGSDDLKARYRTGKVGDVEVKTKLAKAINAYLDPIRDRRAAALARPGYLREMLFEGSKKARLVAVETMARVRDAVKLQYR